MDGYISTKKFGGNATADGGCSGKCDIHLKNSCGLARCGCNLRQGKLHNFFYKTLRALQ